MAAIPFTPPPVPVADLALDARGRLWTCWSPHPDPHESGWATSDSRSSASLAMLLGGHYGPMVFIDSSDFAEVMS
jgi:hypothetical protein